MSILKKIKTPALNNSFFITLILIATLFLGIGYAQIAGIDLEVEGEAIATPAKEVAIIDVEYVSSNNVDISQNTIDEPYLTIMNSHITLGNTLDSSITYKVTIKNYKDEAATYVDAIYSATTGYDNEDIAFTVTGLNLGDKIEPGEEAEVLVTFKYNDQLATITNQELNAIINFKFDSKNYEYYANSLTFDGTADSVINTGVYLYSADNVNRNFCIKFTLDNYDQAYHTASFSNNKPPTILATMKESGSPYPGLAYRLVKNGGNLGTSIKINDSHVTNFQGNYGINNGLNVEIRRENGSIYTKINSSYFHKVLTYGNSIDTFDIPLTLGGNIESNGEYGRIFNGTISNVEVYFYEGTEVTYNYTETRTSNSYRLDGMIEFDGTTYIDTGLNLFSSTNIDKDFEISFTVENYGDNSNQATVLNAKDETQNNVWPGFSYRLRSGSTKYELTSKWPGQADVSHQETPTEPQTITITRESGVIYYSFNGGTKEVLTATPSQSLTNPFVPNLTFGASLNSSGQPFRQFKGIVSNISVNIINP